MRDELGCYLKRGRRAGIDADDLRQEYALGLVEGGHREGIRRVRAAIRSARRPPGPRDVAAAVRGDAYRIDPRNEAVAAASSRCRRPGDGS